VTAVGLSVRRKCEYLRDWIEFVVREEKKLPGNLKPAGNLVVVRQKAMAIMQLIAELNSSVRPSLTPYDLDLTEVITKHVRVMALGPGVISLQVLDAPETNLLVGLIELLKEVGGHLRLCEVCGVLCVAKRATLPNKPNKSALKTCSAACRQRLHYAKDPDVERRRKYLEYHRLTAQNRRKLKLPSLRAMRGSIGQRKAKSD
jgi:hypothetical protein